MNSIYYFFHVRQSPFTRSRHSSVTGSISIPQKRLRQTDPVSQLLEIVHKLVYISFVSYIKTISTLNYIKLLNKLYRYHRIQIIINIVVLSIVIEYFYFQKVHHKI